MSKDNNDPVTDKLCLARMETLKEQINGLKKTIWAAVATATTIIVIAQFILTLIRG